MMEKWIELFNLARERFASLNIEHAKFLGIFDKGKAVYFVYGVSSLTREVIWENFANDWKEISESEIVSESGKKFFWDNVLDMIDVQVSKISHSSVAEEEIRALGNILEYSDIPKEFNAHIVSRIAIIASRLHNEGEEKKVFDYLLGLLRRI
jgi:CTP:phosphocholine cytidylyltransferase-like protein